LWRNEAADPFAKAATIAIGAILAHSIVDYPLRTAAISTVFAICCALIAGPRPTTSARRSREDGHKPRHLVA
jgi:hypothetical protein